MSEVTEIEAEGKRPMFEQPVLPIHDEQGFASVLAELEKVFAPASVAKLLRSMERQGLRARSFEAVLANGMLGQETAARYAALGDSDRGQVRERYLRMVEQVAPELRAKYLKVYAYY